MNKKVEKYLEEKDAEYMKMLTSPFRCIRNKGRGGIEALMAFSAMNVQLRADALVKAVNESNESHFYEKLRYEIGAAEKVFIHAIKESRKLKEDIKNILK